LQSLVRATQLTLSQEQIALLDEKSG
jgi:hypothetical protein